MSTSPGRTPAEDSQFDGLLQKALSSAGSDAMRYVPVRVVPALVSLISIPLFTAVIPPAEYGAYFLIASVLTLLSNLSVGWIASAAVRFYWPQKRAGALDAYMATVLWGSVVSLTGTAAATGLAVWFARDSLSDSVSVLVPTALVFFVVNYLTDLLAQVMRAAKLASAFARLQIAGSVLATALSVVLVWFGNAGAAGILAGGALGWTIVAAPMLRSLASEGSLRPADFNPGLAREMFRYGLPLVPVGVASWALVLLDRLVIQRFAGPDAVGLYSVAYNLGDKLMQMVTVPLLLTMTPSLMEAFENKGQAVAQGLQTQFIRYFSLVSLPVIVGLWASAGPIMTVFTAPEYRAATAVLPVVAAGVALSAFAKIATSNLALHNRTTLIMGDTLVAAIVNVAANWILIPRFGYQVAAWTTAGAYLLLAALAWLQSRRYMPLTIPWFDLARIALACALMGAAVWPLSVWAMSSGSRLVAGAALVAQIVVGATVYLFAAVRSGAIRSTEKAAVIAVTGRLRHRR